MSLFAELKRRNVVRVGAAYVVIGWIIAQVAEFAFENFGAPDWVLKTVVVILLLGLPLALFFAWAYEITPEGLKREEEVDRSVSITKVTGRKLDFVIIAALVVALGYFIWERQNYDRSAPPAETFANTSETNLAEPAAEEITVTGPRSIAVLPFVNMSSDEEQEYFADGLTEEILNSLARAPDLLVSARTSSFSYKGSNKPVPEIAQELGVGHILEGSVRRGGETLRITVQLIRADDGFHLWSETFDRTADDVIAVQEEIAVQIATALETTMDPEALAEMVKSGTNSVAAYNAYLTAMGQIAAARESGDKYRTLDALKSAENAIEIDPEFARAHFIAARFWWSQTQSNQTDFGVTDLPRETIESNLESAIEKAIRFEKDPVLRSSYRTVDSDANFNFRRSLELTEEFLAARPHDEDAFGLYLWRLRRMGELEVAAAMIRERYENYAMSRETANDMLQSLRLKGDAELMRTIAHDAISRYGSDISLIYQAHRQLLWAGDIDGASSLVRRLRNSDLDQDTRLLVDLRQACAENRVAEARDIHASIVENHSDQLSILWLSHEIIGDSEAAGALFDEYDAKRDFDTIASYLTYTHFDVARYPNFMREVAGQGFENRKIIKPPYRCSRQETI